MINHGMILSSLSILVSVVTRKAERGMEVEKDRFGADDFTRGAMNHMQCRKCFLFFSLSKHMHTEADKLFFLMMLFLISSLTVLRPSGVGQRNGPG